MPKIVSGSTTELDSSFIVFLALDRVVDRCAPKLRNPDVSGRKSVGRDRPCPNKHTPRHEQGGKRSCHEQGEEPEAEAFFSGGGRGAAAVRDAAHGDARPASSRDTATAARIARIRVGILNGGEQAHLPAAARAGERVDIERAPHQRRPRPVARGRMSFVDSLAPALPKTAVAGLTAVRICGVERDYGMYQHGEAPQYYPPVPRPATSPS